MAALPYMQFYVAEYQADTMHLTAEEHGAYLLLIFNYWQTGKPIPESRLQKISRVSSDRWADVEQSLIEFFVETDGCWKHERIEADLIAAKDSQAQRAAAGKASAEARKAAKRDELKRQSNARSTPVEQSSNERSTNKEQNRTEQSNNTPSSGDEGAGEKIRPVQKDQPNYEGISNLYNELLAKDFLSEIVKLNEKRKSLIRARWKQSWGEHSKGSDLEFWRKYFLHVRRSKTLTGTKEGFDWRPNFDWLLNESNMIKVIEGYYHQGDDRRSDLQEAS
jgi:uncharacterized protein YdaU (DUF1376 family)